MIYGVAREYLLEFRKENILVLGIKSLLPYQGLIFLANKGQKPGNQRINISLACFPLLYIYL